MIVGPTRNYGAGITFQQPDQSIKGSDHARVVSVNRNALTFEDGILCRQARAEIAQAGAGVVQFV